MEETAINILSDTPTLVLVFFVARWLGIRIDRVMDLHERMLERLLDLTDPRA